MIRVDLKTFHQSRLSGTVTGVIYLEVVGQVFPERGWSDFPVIILGWWIDAWLRLEVATRRRVRWEFMDGPYRATLSKVAGAAVQSAQVYKSLLEAATRVVAHCDGYRMISRDLELLRMNVDRLNLICRSVEDAGFTLQFTLGRQRFGA